VEPAPRAVRVGDRRERGTVTGEDRADAVGGIRAKGNCAGLVHRGAERADGRETSAGVRHHLQAPLAAEEDALTAERELAVETRVPRIVQVGMARDACVQGSIDQLVDRAAIAGEEPRAAVPKCSLKRHRSSVVDRSDVGRKAAEPFTRARYHGEGNHGVMGAPGIEPGTSRV
jgi:hypothetical protein